MSYGEVISASWTVLIALWIVLSFTAKRDVSGKGLAAWWSRIYLLRLVVLASGVVILTRIANDTAHYARADALIFGNALFTPPLALGWTAATISLAGTGFAIRARLHLGRNWSPAPAMKEGHELVTSGPYRHIRHPIYSGILLAALGTALSGTLFGMVVLATTAVIFSGRVGREERIMLGLFPEAYPAYRARTKRLVPFLW